MRQRKQEQSKDNPPDSRICEKCGHEIRPHWQKTNARWGYRCWTCRSRERRKDPKYATYLLSLSKQRHKRALAKDPDYYKKKYLKYGRSKSKIKGPRLSGLQRKHSEEYAAFLEQQDGLCAICHQPETAKTRGAVVKLAIDHDHETGKVRSLLCRNCNVALGLAGDDPERLRAMANYIEFHRKS